MTLLSLAGCYHYVPANDPEPGTSIRALLNAAGAESLTPHFGPGVSELTGTLLGREGEEVSVLVAEYHSQRLGNQPVWNEAVRVPSTGIEQLQRRKLHAARTALFGAGVVGGVALSFVVLDIGGRIFGNDDDADPGPSEMRVPVGGGITILRLPLGAHGR